VALSDGREVVVGRWFLTGRSPDEVREENDRALRSIDPGSPSLADAHAVLLERNALLRNVAGGSTRDLVLDPVAVASEIRLGIAALREERDPYARRPGHLWRTLRVGNVRVPMRLYVPDAVRRNRPMPVVVALHGMGADENVFPEAYGAGEIVRQADRHGFILVSPATGPFMASRRSLGLLLDVLKLHLPVDESRVFLVGHSMGAMSAVAMAQSVPERLAAVAAIAGGGRIRPERSMAPTLFVAGEIDSIVPAARVRAAFDKATAAGYPVEYRLARDHGHTLIVGDRLPDVIAWLLARQRPAGEEGR
jgi:pimeloyl-ACP methyl ester carboxylesterase